MVVYHASFYSPNHPTKKGAVVDNDPDLPFKLIGQEDRDDVLKAREVFTSLFPKGKVVPVGVWKVVPVGVWKVDKQLAAA
jgi:hypothetical protein